MKVREIAQILYAQVYSGEDDLDLEVRSACGADLMSDVMAFVKESVVLLTGLVNPQVVRTAAVTLHSIQAKPPAATRKAV